MVRSLIARILAFPFVLGCGLAVLPAWAQAHCAPTIQSLAQTVLDSRATLPPLQARRFGTRAIYLLMQYGGLDAADAQALLDDAVATRTHGAADLDFALKLDQSGLEATLAALGPDSLVVAVDGGRPSSLRALMTKGHAAEVMATLAAMPAADRWGLYSLVLTVGFDQGDSVKAEWGRLATDHGLPELAAGLAASQADTSAWAAQVTGLSVEETDALAQFWGYWPTFLGNPQIVPSTAPQDAEIQSWRNTTRLASWASARQPELSLLNTFLNQTGDYEAAADVSKAVLKQFESGELTEIGTLDAGWLALYRAFQAAGFDAERFKGAVGSLSINANRVGRDITSDVMDWIVVVDALTPYLQGDSAMPNDPPANLSDGFEAWSQWQALARMVVDDADAAVQNHNADELPVLSELLLAARQYQTLATLLAHTPVTLRSITLADDMAGRMDRQCDAHLWHKGEAPLLAGLAIYKFD